MTPSPVNLGTQPVTEHELERGKIYLSVQYVDEDLLVPIVETLVFRGKDIFEDGDNFLYFQEVESYIATGPVAASSAGADCLLAQSPDNLGAIFEFDRAITALAGCAERWKLRGRPALPQTNETRTSAEPNHMELGQIIAQRTLECAPGDRPVVLSVGTPVASGSDYFCPFEVSGLSHLRRGHAGGVDAVQALLLALQMAATHLYTSDEWKAGRLRWLGSRRLDLPVADSINHLISEIGSETT